MLLTLDTIYILTTAKKGARSIQSKTGLLANGEIAKYLDQVKGGRFPVEVLVRGKDAAENEKLFVKIAETIKEAGVSHSYTLRRMR